MNENKYFSHDSNARNSDKILPLRMRHGAEGYGIYFMILERLREEPEYMSVKDYNMIAFDLRVDAGKVKSIVEDFGLFVFTEDGKYFYSESFKRRMQRMDAKSEKLSEAGKRGNEKRWGKQRDFIGTQSPPDRICDKKTSQTKQNKTNKNKTNIPLSPNGDISLSGKQPTEENPEILTEKNSKKEKSSAKKERKVFTPPSVDEVSQYCKENNYTISPWKFVNYYTSNGWMVGRNKMKDWKAAVRTWQLKENDNGNRQLPASNQINSGKSFGNSSGNDAAHKRAELDNLEKLAEAVLRNTNATNG